MCVCVWAGGLAGGRAGVRACGRAFVCTWAKLQTVHYTTWGQKVLHVYCQICLAEKYLDTPDSVQNKSCIFTLMRFMCSAVSTTQDQRVLNTYCQICLAGKYLTHQIQYTKAVYLPWWGSCAVLYSQLRSKYCFTLVARFIHLGIIQT